MTAHKLADFIGDGARADGFEELTRFLDGIVSQNPSGLSDDEMSFVRLLKIMSVAATEGANQEWERHRTPMPVIALGLCRAAGFAVTSAVLSTSSENANLDELRQAIMHVIGLGVDYMIEDTRKHWSAA